jgi:hypothetical protein
MKAIITEALTALFFVLCLISLFTLEALLQ